MRKQDDLGVKAALGAFAFLAASVLVLVWANSWMPFSHLDKSPLIIRNYLALSGLLSTTTLLLSVYLAYTYLKLYWEVKSKFALGILVSVFAFTLYSLVSNPLFLLLVRIGRGSIFLSLVPTAFAAIALATLAWVSSK